MHRGLYILLLFAAMASASPQAAAPTATVEGAVIDAVTGRPIAGASVVRRLPSPRSPETQAAIARANGPVNFTAAEAEALRNPTIIGKISEADGHYLIDNLDTGRISLTFSKVGYVASSETFTLTPNQHLKDVAVRLTPMSIVYGRVFNASGAPVVGASVTPLTPQTTNRSSFSAWPGASTNDRGEFRMFNLVAGTYMFQVTLQARVGFTSQPSTEPPNSPGGVLYPGVRNLSEAIAVEVRPGTETRLEDIVLTPGIYGTIRIRVVNPVAETPKTFGYRLANLTPTYSNTSADGMVTVARAGEPSLRGKTEQLDPGNSMVNTHYPIAPGNYEAAAIWNDASGVSRTASVTFSFTGRDVEAELILAKPQGRLSCRSMIEDDTGALTRAVNVRTTLQRNLDSGVGCNTSTTGVYSMDPIPTGAYKIKSVGPLPPNTYLAAARHANRDALTEGVNVTTEETTLELLLRTGAGVLRAKSADSQGGPVRAFVLLVPEPSLESLDLVSGYPVSRSDQNGDLEVRNIVPGAYTVYAVSSLGDNFERNGFLKNFEGRGRIVTFARGETVSMSVTLLDEK